MGYPWSNYPFSHLLSGPRRRCDAAHTRTAQISPRGAGISAAGTGLDLGDRAPDRRMDRSVVPVVAVVLALVVIAMIPGILIALAVVAAAALVHHDLPESGT